MGSIFYEVITCQENHAANVRLFFMQNYGGGDLGEKCGSHDGICEQITETRLSQARTEETVKGIPILFNKMDVISTKMDGMKGFVAGISFAISLIMGLLTLGVAFWKAGAK